MLLDQKVKMKWNGNNYKWYLEKGYEFNGWNNEFEIDVFDLPPRSNYLVYFQCDYCGKIMKRKYNQYTMRNLEKTINKDACGDCKNLKTNETLTVLYGTDVLRHIDGISEKIIVTNLEKYNSPSPLGNKEVREKIKQTLIRNIGVDNPLKNEDILHQCQETNLKRYGVINPIMNNEIKLKANNTKLEKYGTIYCLQNNKIKIKMENTCIERFGVKNAMQNEAINFKARKSLYKNGTAMRSNQQEYICNLLNGKLNYPVGGCSVDILLDKNIAIEYSGGGHTLGIKLGNMTTKEFENKQRRREIFLKSKGYKQIEIISRKDYLPSDDTILDMITFAKDYILNENRSWIKFDIDNKTITSSQFRYYNVDFGKLRKIKKSDLQAS